MGILKKIFGDNKKTTGNNLIVSNKALKNNGERLLSVHPDIVDFLWIGDGPRKNYISNNNENVIDLGTFKVSISFGYEEEPSLLLLNLPISSNNLEVDQIPYYPSYKELTPKQRGVYWEFLRDPYKNNIDIGYVFLLYYGLERYLLTDRYEEVIYIILKLRDVHQNKSFQSYSASAIILSCLQHQRADLVLKFMDSLDKDYKYEMSDNLYLLCKYSFDMPLTVDDIIRMAKTFEFTNNNYIKKYLDIFKEILGRNILDCYNSDEGINCSTLLSKSEFKKLKTISVPIFANVSIRDKCVNIPEIISSFHFKKDIYDLLVKTHEDVKKYLASSRKAGIVIQEKKKTVKEKEVLSFDITTEKNLLNELTRTITNPLEHHFIFIQLQNFYYKYRSLGEEYIDQCIKYCEDDINSLNILQEQYKKEQLSNIKRFSSFLGKAEVQDRISKVDDFKGEIPAFKRLAIIYEKRKCFDQAINICDRAINYYTAYNMDNLVDDFVQRKSKLLKKKIK